MELLVLLALIGLIPAAIADKKGRSFVAWWLYGALLFIVALPHALLMDTDREVIERRQLRSGSKKCPFCAELIKIEATVCRYCGRELPALPTSGAASRGYVRPAYVAEGFKTWEKVTGLAIALAFVGLLAWIAFSTYSSQGSR